MNPFLPVKWLDSCPSTQEVAKSDLAPGLVVATLKQTQGRGRGERSWISPDGNLAVSFVSDSYDAKSDYQRTLIVALALSDVLEKVAGVTCEVKWPNDVWCGGKKIAGILAEACAGQMVFGVGLNLNSSVTDFPEDLQGQLTTLKNETGQTTDPKMLLSAFLEQVFQYDALFCERDLKPFVESLQGRLSFVGRPVELRERDELVAQGELVGIADDAALLIRNAQGETQSFLTGDLSLRCT